MNHLDLFGLNLNWWPICIPWTLMRHRNPKTNIETEWTFRRGKRDSRKNKKSKRNRVLNGFGDPSFPLPVESGLVALFCTGHSAFSRCRIKFGCKLGAMLAREQCVHFSQRLCCVPVVLPRCDLLWKVVRRTRNPTNIEKDRKISANMIFSWMCFGFSSFPATDLEPTRNTKCLPLPQLQYTVQPGRGSLSFFWGECLVQVL